MLHFLDGVALTTARCTSSDRGRELPTIGTCEAVRKDVAFKFVRRRTDSIGAPVRDVEDTTKVT